MRVADREVGPGQPVFVIAEAGVNHNGDAAVARELIRTARDCGADCVKFQTFKAERLVTAQSPKADYQLQTTDREESQLAMLRSLEIAEAVYPLLLEECQKANIVFLSTPYSVEDVEFLDGLGVAAFKIASGQIVEPTFVRHVAAKRKPVILSTGMATLAEVDAAVRDVRETGNERLVLLQCTTNYPSRPEDANIRAMVTMRAAFDVPVGYSDHTQSEAAALAAVALGACVIEKHFTLDKALPGPDQSSSANPDEFRRLVRLIRETEAALGSGRKGPVAAEQRNALGMRRSLVAAVPIARGTVIAEAMIAYKRPGTGIRPERLGEVVGRVAARDIPRDGILAWEWLQ
jgi:N,N'-diacetyllegionaminate synthase